VYREHLAPEIAMPSTTAGAIHSYHLLVIQTDQRDRVVSGLKEDHVEHGIHYPVPIHRMGIYRFLGYRQGSLRVTEAAADRILSLPLYPELPTSAAERVCAIVNGSIGK
jgi:dTDP-4-amino-4,6-dideoxygalactose transaminase